MQPFEPTTDYRHRQTTWAGNGNRQTCKQPNGCYQTHYLPALRSVNMFCWNSMLVMCKMISGCVTCRKELAVEPCGAKTCLRSLSLLIYQKKSSLRVYAMSLMAWWIYLKGLLVYFSPFFGEILVHRAYGPKKSVNFKDAASPKSGIHGYRL